jgi:hypothetical protein
MVGRALPEPPGHAEIDGQDDRSLRGAATRDSGQAHEGIFRPAKSRRVTPTWRQPAIPP